MKKNLLLIIFTCLFLVSGISVASPFSDRILVARSAVSLDEAVRNVKEETGGRILSARTETRGRKQVHVIKVLLPSGRVRIVKVNAR